MRSSLAFAALLLVGTSSAVLSQDRLSTAAEAGGIVRITAADGDVRVRANTTAQVRVIDLDGGNERGLRVRREGAQVTVDIFDGRDVEVLVPADSRLEVRSSSGDIDIDGIRGSISLETANGDMVVGGRPSSVTAESISGDVRIVDAVANVRLNTVSGDIELPRANGTINVQSTSGDIDIGGSGIRNATISTTSGDIGWRGIVARDAVVEISTASGTIDMEVPADIGADFDVESITSRIRSDIGPEPTRNRWTGGERLRFTNARGGARIVVRNVSGGVYIVVR